MAAKSKAPTRQQRTIARRYVGLTADKLFDLFYTALPKTSLKFQELVDDINALAEGVRDAE